METQIVFSLKELLLASVLIALVVLIVYIILVLREVLLSVKLLRTVVDEKREHIDEILEITPSIMGNVDRISDIAAKGTESAYKGAVGLVEKIKQGRG
ncbi:MAG TPA: hypothetical protein VFD08_03910 [Clostridia bacterium]|nr:hypothetical protein [Clostridia bacterium]